MQELNYDMLTCLTKSTRSHLQLVDVDVTRLGNDDSEVRNGDEVELVAIAKLRVVPDALVHVKDLVSERLYGEIAKCVDLVTINSDADLESAIPIDKDSVQKWLTENYRFNFLLDGAAYDRFRTIGSDNNALPWVKTLNTGEIPKDHFIVTVKVDELTPPALPPSPPVLPPPPPRKILVSIGNQAVEFGGVKLELKLDVEGPYASAQELQGKTFWLPLHPEDDNVRLVVTVRDVALCSEDEPESTNTKPARHTRKY